jgi:glycosyltransferase involved in cell wall biosynthesis
MAAISILIANYNNSRFIKTAIESVITQDNLDWEIVIVDDASTDNFAQVMGEFLTHPKVKIFYNRMNMGCGFTKKRCIELADAEILGFLDPDDALHPSAIQTMINAHQEYPHASLIHSTHFICDENLKISGIASYPKKLPINTPYLLVSDGSIHHFATFKKANYLLTEQLSPDNLKAVDQDLYYKLEETGPIHFVDQPLYHYRIHSGSISNAGKEKEALRYHYKIIEQACLRRISLLNGNTPAIHILRKKYTTRYYKIRIINSFRNRNILRFVSSVAIFPFVGGMANIISYIRKLPKEGFSLIKRSFFDVYHIKA